MIDRLSLLSCATVLGLVTAIAAPAAVRADAPAPAGSPVLRPAPPTPAPARGDGQKGMRRFALVIGANDGGGNRVVLRFAGSDARAFSRVLRDLGGAAPDDLEVLVDPSLPDIHAGFARLDDRMSAARTGGQRIELIVYYSGHSDEEGLLLSGRRLSYAALREQIRRMPADVQIAILDSCASGAFTRVKGGVKRPAFLIDEAHRVHGHAFLSSSSATEQAQESDRLGGSFFTHYFVGGLRGAADANRDRRVTLNEAYQFAFNETVTRTTRTRYGAQHPGYEMHLVGTGDVVLTDLRGSGATLVLGKELAGRMFVRDRAQRLVLELGKQGGSPIALALSPDTYHLTLRDDQRSLGATVALRQGQRVTVGWSSFEEISSEMTVARGDLPPGQSAADLRPTPLHIDLFRVPSNDERTRHFLSLNLLVGGGAWLDGLEIGGLVNMRTERVRGAQIAGIGNFSMGPSALQVAGITNWSLGPVEIGQVGGILNWSAGVEGLQAAGIANVAKGPVRGVQVAGITNLQRDGNAGLQLAGIANWTTGDLQLGQVSGIAGWTGGAVEGFQVSGIASLAAGAMRGVQIGGITNQAGGDVRGLQIGGIHNRAGGDVTGAQVSLLNVGGVVEGAQIGLINVAREIRGLQLGLVNVATESSARGAPIGVLSVARDGRRTVDAWLADVIPARVGVRLGSQRVYTLLALGASADHLAAGLGLGVHLPGAAHWIDLDVSTYAVRQADLGESYVNQLVEARVMVGIPLSVGFSVFAGVSSAAAIEYDGDGRDLAPLTIKRVSTGDADIRFSPGLFAGLSY